MASLKSYRFVSFALSGRNCVIYGCDGRRNLSKIGFVGLGNMGKPMAKNLLQKGFQVTVYDSNCEISNSLSEDGAKVATNLKEVASDVECVITMLPNNDSVLDVYSKNDGIISNIKKGTVLVDSSTVSPHIPQTLSSLAEKKGAIFLDTPVSGGVMAAQSAMLTFMVGGPEEGVKLIDKVLRSMGRNVIHCGPTGSGQVAKICNNLVLAISMAGLSEAMNLGVRLGLDPKVLSSIINTSSGRCWSSEVYNPVPGVTENVPSSRNYEMNVVRLQLTIHTLSRIPSSVRAEDGLHSSVTYVLNRIKNVLLITGGFATRLLVKDLNLAKDAAELTSSPTPLGNIALKLYNDIVKSGNADHDFSIIYDFLKNKKSFGVL